MGIPGVIVKPRGMFFRLNEMVRLTDTANLRIVSPSENNLEILLLKPAKAPFVL